jgi:outer membrane receptor for ferrienterochelin and colicin
MKQPSDRVPPVSKYWVTSLRGETGIVVLPFFTYTNSGNVVVAQESELVLEEIVVTARKREERLQDNPIAVSGVSGENIRQFDYYKLEWLLPSIPNFPVNPGRGERK